MKFKLFLVAFLSFNIFANSTPAIGVVDPSDYIPKQKETAMSSTGMVTTQHYIATRVGENVLSDGGNAYDAAVAIGFALAVVLPRAGNIGGGGFMLMYNENNQEAFSIDYREKAPAASYQKMYLNNQGELIKGKSTYGYLASGVPGTVAGLWEVHKKFGSLPWDQLLAPAIDLAENGFEVSVYMSDMLIRYHEKLSGFEETSKIFQKDYPNFLTKKFIQKDLAQTLKIIAKNGRDGFYKGRIANHIAKDMSQNGGLITKTDLENYQPVWRKPLVGTYKDVNIITMGPPSSGGVHILQMLNILENFNLKKLGHNSIEYVNILTETMKHAYADRSLYLGDPDYYQVPVNKLINKTYANNIASKISKNKITPSSKIKPGRLDDVESFETTHFSVADSQGNIISSTYTLNSSFGSGVVIKGTGILMNNEMDDFSAAPGIPNQFGLLGSEANEIQPGKRPLSSMTPTIVTKNNEFFFSTGSPGGSRIISAVLQSIINIVDFDMNLEDATKAIRIHHQWYPDLLQIENGYPEGLAATLENNGYNVKFIKPATCIQTIMKSNEIYYGYGDFRRPDAFASGEINVR